MGTSSSDHEIVYADNVEEAAKLLAEKKVADATSEREVAGWETTILFDGLEACMVPNEKYHEVYGMQNEINTVASSMAKEMIMLIEMRQKEKRTAAEVQRKKEKEAHERDELKRLSDKYKVNTNDPI